MSGTMTIAQLEEEIAGGGTQIYLRYGDVPVLVNNKSFLAACKAQGKTEVSGKIELTRAHALKFTI